MNICKICGKSGIFLKLSTDKICDKCNQSIINDVYKRVNQGKKKKYKGNRNINENSQSTVINQNGLRESMAKENREAFCCPYCDMILDQKPKSGTKCPHCDEIMYVRTLPLTDEVKIVTEKEKDRINENRRAWKEFQILKGWTDLSNKDFINTQGELKELFDIDPPFRNVVWRLYDDLACGSEHDPKKQSSIYYAMASYLEKEGRDPFKMLKLANTAKLKSLKKKSILRS